ncbi:MAG: PDZ domain-containing protein [Lewinellaceae bacterium]|nr:PDZ domain-containing protein [Saprospiraceae bacterium]MCB9345345.1 PDZ domain-containing protein [Lewinellaceae bacterium]
MKTTSILLAAAFLLLPWCITPLFSQETNDNPEKKITIIKHYVEDDGTEVTETIIKKGKAAEDFDVDAFVRENDTEENEIEVIVHDVMPEMEFHGIHGMAKGLAFASCDNKSPYLGVQEDSDEDPDAAGVVVDIVRGTAADKAGLHNNDKILQINDVKTDKWSDLTGAISALAPGDKLSIRYSRDGKEASTEAMLTTRSEVSCIKGEYQKGFLGVSDEDEDEDEPGVAVSITEGSGAEKAGLQDGDVIYQLNTTAINDFEDITDFMAYTKPDDKVTVVYERDGQRNTTEATLGTNNHAAVIEDINVEIPEINFEFPDVELAEPADIRVNEPRFNWEVKEKEACLGVYSNAHEDHGAEIQSFTELSAASEAGMHEGDVITSVNAQVVNTHSELWDEIAKYKTGDAVEVAFEREGEPMQIKATLKACKDKTRIDVLDNFGKDIRRFYTWDWNAGDHRRIQETRIIIIRKAGEGDVEQVKVDPKPAVDRSLQLESFRAFPNPSEGAITVEFKAEPVETVVSLFDVAGRQLFREELNAFNGEYSQQFDLTAYAKGTIVIHVQQNNKVYTEQIIVQ